MNGRDMTEVYRTGRADYRLERDEKYGEWVTGQDHVRVALLSINGYGEIRWRVGSRGWSGDDGGEAAAQHFGLTPFRA
jgi:hypothetical protein